MENHFIARVRRIANGKSINGVPQTVNIVVIDLTGGKPSIVRNYPQFLQDLKNSFLIDENVNSMNHPQVTTVLRGLRRGLVSGSIQFTKKGDKFKVTEDSSVITNPSHPEFGQWSIGEEREATADRAIIDGFLDIEPNDQYALVQATATARVSAESAVAGAFEDFSVADEPVVDELPASAIAEVLGKEKATTTKK